MLPSFLDVQKKIWIHSKLNGKLLGCCVSGQLVGRSGPSEASDESEGGAFWTETCCQGEKRREKES